MTSAGPVAVKRAASGEMILVVEDEDIVRDLVCEILRGEGYRVLSTDRGSEALRLLREDERGIDLLISDVVMPEMNGARVAQHVHELCPRARVLFVSGYSESDMADQGLETLAFQVLQKPFTPDTLTQKVRAVLDA
jgi:DNA-binding NtrC family response regulator